MGWLLSGRGLLGVFSLFYLALATRTLGLRDFGQFALINGAVQALAAIVGFQTWQIVVRFGMEHLARDDERGLGRLVRLCFALDLASAVVGIVLAALILHFGAASLGIGVELYGPTLALAVIQLLSIRSTAIGVLRLRDRFARSALADAVTPSVRLAGSIAAALVWPTVTGFLAVWALAEVATALAYWLLLMRGGDLTHVVQRGDGSIVADNPGILRFMASTNLAATLGLSSKQLPLLIVGAYVGPVAAGAFRLALQVAQALTKLAQLITRAAFPEIVRAARAADPARLSRIAFRGIGATTLGAAAIMLLLALTGEWLLVAIGGRAFASAYPVLLWLAAAGCVDLAAVSFEPVLLAANRSGVTLAIRIATVALQLAATALLLPLVGAVGAAIGVFVASVAGAALFALAISARRSPAP